MLVTMFPIALISDFVAVKDIEYALDASGLTKGLDYHDPRRPRMGEVVAVGPGRWNDHASAPDGTVGNIGATQREPMPCKVGDKVILQLGAGTEVKVGHEMYRIVPARDLFGVATEL